MYEYEVSIRDNFFIAVSQKLCPGMELEIVHKIFSLINSGGALKNERKKNSSLFFKYIKLPYGMKLHVVI